MREAPQVLGIVLAGGEGKRLYPLTADRAKPAVPFGGAYRLIDFVLSNLVNASYLRICVLTQYKSHSLDRHIAQTWRMSTMRGNHVTPVPAQQRPGPRGFTRSAGAIYHSPHLIHDEQPPALAVLGADRDRGYWRDVGTLDAYYDALMDLVAVHPIFNLYNRDWTIFTSHPQSPPAKFVEGGSAQESIVSNGVIVSAGTVRTSVLSPGVRLDAGAYVEGSV